LFLLKLILPPFQPFTEFKKRGLSLFFGADDQSFAPYFPFKIGLFMNFGYLKWLLKRKIMLLKAEKFQQILRASNST